MKRYIPITLESEPSIIGVKNGIYQCEIKPKKFKSLIEYKKLSDFYDGYEFDSKKNRKINGVSEIEYCQLLKKAYLTNILSFSPHLFGCHFVIDEKTHSIFKNFNFGEYSEFIPLKLFDNKGQLVREKYYLLFQDLILNSWIDFKNSVFYKGHSFTNDKENISFNSPIDYKEELFVNTENIVLNDNFDSSLDFFTTRIDTNYFVSENLLLEMEKNGLTGIIKSERINKITVANNV
ncbi:hypothetical protein SAMN03080594_103107 [Arenibacter palladensis]|uniref:Uncharacterized protein n=1 Tax=Arenibacter palladensis TaxID=237373 RepID=A0A1M5A628_9FLAO|nr:hypothetical protein [Arenibacter palladensis]SHF25720.1 hypothetical protein SAMN03080594_103107 [Arenibacter palladensis]